MFIHFSALPTTDDDIMHIRENTLDDDDDNDEMSIDESPDGTEKSSIVEQPCRYVFYNRI